MAAGDRIQVALKPEVEAVATTAATTNTALGELDTRVQATEGFETRIDQLETDTGALDITINDPTTGLIKQLTDVDSEINTADTGIKARLDDLEQGGVNTTKFRTHTPSGSYEDGEIVLVGRSQYRANNAMDGSATPIPFVAGSGENQWQPVSVHNEEIDLIVEYNNSRMTINPQVVTSTNGPSMVGLVLDPVRKRASIGVSGTGTQSDLIASDLVTYGDVVSYSAKKAYTSNPSNPMAAMIDSNGHLSYNANITETELNHLNGVDSNIQTQINGKVNQYWETNPTTSSRVALVRTAGDLSYSAITSTELGYLDGVTSGIQGQLDSKWTEGGEIRGTSTNFDVVQTSGNGFRISGGGSIRCKQSGSHIGGTGTNERWNTIYYTTLNSGSDERLKEFYEYPTSLLDVWLDTVKPKSYHYKDDDEKKKRFGVIAQDVIKAFDLAGLDWKEYRIVQESEEGYYGVDYNEVQAVELAAIRHRLGLQ